MIKALDKMYEQKVGNPYKLFGKMLSLARKIEPDKEFLIFVDEFDRLPDHSGMGDFIKHCGAARAIIVGVAETPSELIGHHLSAERKIMGAEIPVPPLTQSEIAQIFQKASDIVRHHSKYVGITFDNAFVDAIVGAAGGYPAIAQFLGYQSVDLTDALQKARESTVVIGIEEFTLASRAIFKFDGLESKAELNSRLKAVIGQSTKRAAMLDFLSEQDGGWINIASFRNRLPKEHQDRFNRNLDALVDGGVLTHSESDNKVRFSTPVLRLLVRLAKVSGVLYPP
jgi:hypothetical protein